MRITELVQQLKPFVIRWISELGGSPGPYAPSPHDLASAHHTGSLADSQATQFLKTDGTRALTGNLAVNAGVTIDGVDISAHAADANAHHAQSHVLATTAGLGADHTTSGLTVGQVLRATGATTAAFAAIQDVDLPSTIVRTSRQIIAGNGLTGGGTLSSDVTLHVGAGAGITVNADDVALAPTVAGAGLTYTNGVLAVSSTTLTVSADAVDLPTPGTLTVSTVNSATAPHTHAITTSANPGAAAAILASDAAGKLTLQGLNLGTATGAGTGDVRGSGVLQMAGTGTHYLMGNVGIGMTNPSYKLDVNGNIRFSGGWFGYSASSPSTSQTIGGIWVPRQADISGFIMLDYMDEAYYWDKRYNSISITPSQNSGTTSNLFRDDSSYLTWNSGTSPYPITIEIDSSSSPITHKNNGHYQLGLTFRSGGVVNPSHIKIELWDNSSSSYTTVYDQDVSITGGYACWLSSRFVAPSGSGYHIYKIKVTLSGTNPLSNDFRIQRFMIYHDTAEFDPWHLHIKGGTVYGGVNLAVSGGNVGIGTTNPSSFRLQVAGNVGPDATDTYDIGSSSRLWRRGFLSQLNALVFAEQTAQLLGGWFIIPKDAGTLAADVASSDTTIDFGKAMTTGHFVLIRAHDTGGAIRTEYIQVGSLVSGTRYNVTRDLANANSPDPAWAKGTAFAVLGTSGDGRIELNAYDTPRISVIRQGATYNAQDEKIRLGDLNGIGGYASETYGIFIGDTANNKWLAYDPVNSLRIRGDAVVNGTITADKLSVSQLSAITANMGALTVTDKLTMSGAASAIAIGTTPPTSPTSGTGIWIDRTGLYGLNANVQQAYISSTGQLLAGEGNVILDANGIRVEVPVSQTDSRSYLFTSAGNTRGGLYGFETTTENRVTLDTTPVGGKGTQVWINARAPGNYTSIIQLASQSGINNGVLKLTYNDTGTQTLDILGVTVNMDRGLNVGTATGAGTGDVKMSGSVRQSTALGCRVISTVTQTIPNETLTALSFDTEIYDTDNCWSANSPTRLVAQTAGYYIAGGGWALLAAQNTVASRHWVGVRRSDGVIFGANETHTVPNRSVTVSCATGLFYMSAGQYIEVVAYHGQGGDRTAAAASTTYQHVCVGWLQRVA